MEERITVKKESFLKDLVLAGLQAKGYELIQETGSQYTIKVYYNKAIGTVALYDSGSYQDDELVIVNLYKPGKVNILIKEYRSKEAIFREKNRFNEIADILENLISKHSDRAISKGTLATFSVVK